MYAKVTGRVDFQEMLARANGLGQMSQITKKLKILEDARGIIVDFRSSDLNGLIKIIEENVGDFEFVRHAVIHSEPTGTAYAMLTSQISSSDKYKIMTFSTEEAAIQWLQYW
jgi:hypothetical protein